MLIKRCNNINLFFNILGIIEINTEKQNPCKVPTIMARVNNISDTGEFWQMELSTKVI